MDGETNLLTDEQIEALTTLYGSCNHAILHEAAELVRQWAVAKCHAYADRKQALADAATSLREKIARPTYEISAMTARDLAEELGG